MGENGGGVGENTHELEKNAKMLEKINAIMYKKFVAPFLHILSSVGKELIEKPIFMQVGLHTTHNWQNKDQRFWAHISLKSRHNQSTRTISASTARHGIFNLAFTKIFWTKKASQHMKKLSAYRAPLK